MLNLKRSSSSNRLAKWGIDKTDSWSGTKQNSTCFLYCYYFYYYYHLQLLWHCQSAI